MIQLPDHTLHRKTSSLGRQSHRKQQWGGNGICKAPDLVVGLTCDRVHISAFCYGHYVARLFKKSTAVI